MTTAKQQFLSPVGRIVQGHPMDKQTKNQQGQPLVTTSGQPTQRYFVALAFRKDDPQFPAFYALLNEEARRAFPQHFTAQGQCTHPRFSMKVMDGDGIDENGKSNATKEGFAGHWVVKFQSSFPPKCFNKGHYQPHEQIQDPNMIRRGYFGRVSGTVEGNGQVAKPGIYVNLGMFELSAQGVEIVGGPDASAVFGGTAPVGLPVGATPLPSAGAMPQMPPAMPAMPQMPPAMPAMPQMPPAMPAMPVVPNPQFVNGPAEPQKTAAWPPNFTYTQMIAGGWSDATLRQAGYIA